MTVYYTYQCFQTHCIKPVLLHWIQIQQDILRDHRNLPEQHRIYHNILLL